MWYVYIIETITQKLYTGITKDIERRFLEHSQKKSKGAKFFRLGAPKKVVYQEKFSTKSHALEKRE